MSIFTLPYYTASEILTPSPDGEWGLLRNGSDEFLNHSWPRGPRIEVVRGLSLFVPRHQAAHEWADPLTSLITDPMERARQLGVATLVCEFVEPYLAEDGRGYSYQEGLNRLSRALRESGPLISRMGVRLAILARQGHFLNSPPEMRELVDQALCPWHGAALRVAPGEDRSWLGDWIETLGQRLFAVLVSPEWDREDFAPMRNFIEAKLESASCPADFLIPIELW